MKKSTIWIIAIIMGFSFLALLFLQFSYVEEMVKMKKEQFDESVNRALYQASRNLDMNETQRYLEKDVQDTERRAYKQDSVMIDGLDGTIKHSHQFAVAADDGTVYSSFQLKTFEMKPASVPKAMILRKDKNSLSEAAKSMQEIVRNRYVYQKALLDEVVYNILYTASDKPLKGERQGIHLLSGVVPQRPSVEDGYCEDSFPRNEQLHLLVSAFHDTKHHIHNSSAHHVPVHHHRDFPPETLL